MSRRHLTSAPALRAIVIDTPTTLSEVTLALLDSSDVVLSIVTYDSTTIHNTIAVAEVFSSIGYGPEKMNYLITGRIRAAASDATNSRVLSVDGRTSRLCRTVGSSCGEPTRACPLSSPAPMRRESRYPAGGANSHGSHGKLPGEKLRPCPIRVPSCIRLWCCGLTVLREILRRLPVRVDHLPGDQRPRSLRHPHRRRVRRFSVQALDRSRAARREGPGRGLQHIHVCCPRRLPAPL